MTALVLSATAYLAAPSYAGATEVTLYKNPQCGCCQGYADYLGRNGFTVTVKATYEVEAMSRAAGIPVFEKNFSLVECYGAEEAFVTGTFGAQTAVGEIDGRVIGTGEMGPMTERIRALYKELVA